MSVSTYYIFLIEYVLVINHWCLLTACPYFINASNILHGHGSRVKIYTDGLQKIFPAHKITFRVTCVPYFLSDVSRMDKMTFESNTIIHQICRSAHVGLKNIRFTFAHACAIRE